MKRKITRLTAIAMAGILITGTSLNPKTAYAAEDAHTIAYNDSAMDENYYSGEDINTSIAPDEEYKIWAYTLDKEHNIINLLNLKDKNQTNLIIYDNYMINGECYKAELYNAHSTFVSNKTLESVIFGKNVKITACISDGRATGMFSGCTNLKKVDFNNSLSLGTIKEMYCMFADCTSLKEINFGNANTINVTDMSSMFRGCSSLTNLDLSSFDTRNVKKMYAMFMDCSSLTSLDLSNFITRNTTMMTIMFKNCSQLTDLNVSRFNTSNVTSMSNMFINCTSLTTLDLRSFDTHKLETGQDTGIFSNCASLTKIDVTTDKWTKTTKYNLGINPCILQYH